MENKPDYNAYPSPIEKLLFESMFSRTQEKKKAAHEELFMLIDHILDKGACISFQICKDGTIDTICISCIPNGEKNEKY